MEQRVLFDSFIPGCPFCSRGVSLIVINCRIGWSSDLPSSTQRDLFLVRFARVLWCVQSSRHKSQQRFFVKRVIYDSAFARTEAHLFFSNSLLFLARYDALSERILETGFIRAFGILGEPLFSILLPRASSLIF